jgi:hypothetical protein
MMNGSFWAWATALSFFPLNGLRCRFGWGTWLAGALLVISDAHPARPSRHFARTLRHERGVTSATGGLVILGCLFVIVSVSGPLPSADWDLYLTLIAAVAAIWGSARRTP